MILIEKKVIKVILTVKQLVNSDLKSVYFFM